MIMRPSDNSSIELTHRVIFISGQLGLYHAELARILHLQCADIGRLTGGKALLEPATVAWRQAQRLSDFYNLLVERLDGDDVAIYHWLRARNEFMEVEPLLMIVDHDQLEAVIRLLQSGITIRQER